MVENQLSIMVVALQRVGLVFLLGLPADPSHCGIRFVAKSLPHVSTGILPPRCGFR
jgi:hypothetical protein